MSFPKSIGEMSLCIGWKNETHTHTGEIWSGSAQKSQMCLEMRHMVGNQGYQPNDS